MDIFKITNSKTRKAIFKLYFARHEKKYYLRELERILNLPVQNIRREFLALEKNGIFTREKQGNQVYYSLNTKSPIFSEIKSIVSKTIGAQGELKKALISINGIKTAFIFGSFANGKEDSLSDIDLMIVGEIDENMLVRKISKLENQLDREINYHIYSQKEFAKRVKEKDFFISGILSKPVIFLVENDENIPRIR
jgi:predicted nucleotidyltransferase